MPRNASIQPSISPLTAIYWAIVKHWRRRKFEVKEIMANFFSISMCLSVHPVILVDITLHVHLPISPLSLWACLSMEDWSGRVLGRGTWFPGFDELPIKVVTLYIYFYINRNIHFSSKFHVQLFIFVSLGIVSLYMFKWIMLVCVIPRFDPNCIKLYMM